jgi:hypothetical protein
VRRTKKSTADKMSNALSAATTPMPAFAPVESPLLEGFVSDPVLEELVGALMAEDAVLDGWAVVKELVPLRELVEYRERSCCLYSMYMGCAHMVTGPVMVVVVKSAWPTRSSTAVEPLASG